MRKQDLALIQRHHITQLHREISCLKHEQVQLQKDVRHLEKALSIHKSKPLNGRTPALIQQLEEKIKNIQSDIQAKDSDIALLAFKKNRLQEVFDEKLKTHPQKLFTSIDLALIMYKKQMFWLPSHDNRCFISHLHGCDFTKSVRKMVMPVGTVLVQSQVPLADQGSYYTHPDATADDVGINPYGTAFIPAQIQQNCEDARKAPSNSNVQLSEEVKEEQFWVKIECPDNSHLRSNTNNSQAVGSVMLKQQKFYLTKDEITVLLSTAKPIRDSWSVAGQDYCAPGGGMQIMTTQRGDMKRITSTKAKRYVQIHRERDLREVVNDACHSSNQKPIIPLSAPVSQNLASLFNSQAPAVIGHSNNASCVVSR